MQDKTLQKTTTITEITIAKNSHRSNNTQAATIVYASKVPIDIMLTNCLRSKRAAISPARIKLALSNHSKM